MPGTVSLDENPTGHLPDPGGAPTTDQAAPMTDQLADLIRDVFWAVGDR